MEESKKEENILDNTVFINELNENIKNMKENNNNSFAYLKELYHKSLTFNNNLLSKGKSLETLSRDSVFPIFIEFQCLLINSLYNFLEKVFENSNDKDQSNILDILLAQFDINATSDSPLDIIIDGFQKKIEQNDNILEDLSLLLGIDRTNKDAINSIFQCVELLYNQQIDIRKRICISKDDDILSNIANKNDFDNLQNEYLKLQKENENLKRVPAEKVPEIQLLKSEIQDIQLQMNTIQSKNNNLLNENNELKSETNVLKEALEISNTKNSKMNDRIILLEKDLEELDKAKHQATEKLNDVILDSWMAKYQNNNKTSQIDQRNEIIDEENNQKGALEILANQLEEQTKELDKESYQRGELTKLLSKSFNAIQYYENFTQNINKENKDIKEELKLLREQKNNFEKKLKKALDDRGVTITIKDPFEKAISGIEIISSRNNEIQNETIQNVANDYDTRLLFGVLRDTEDFLEKLIDENEIAMEAIGKRKAYQMRNEIIRKSEEISEFIKEQGIDDIDLCLLCILDTETNPSLLSEEVEEFMNQLKESNLPKETSISVLRHSIAANLLLRRSVENANRRSSQLQSENKSLRAQLIQSNNDFEELSKSRTEVFDEIFTPQKSINTKQSMGEASIEDKPNLQDDEIIIDDIENKQNLESNLENKEAEIEMLKKLIDHLRIKSEAKEIESKQLTNRLKEYEREINDMKREFEQMIVLQQNEREEYEEKLAEKRAENEATKTELNGIIEEERERYTELEMSFKDISEKFEITKAQFEENEAKCSTIEEQNRALRKTQRKEGALTRTRESELNDTIRSLREEVANLKALNQSLEIDKKLMARRERTANEKVERARQHFESQKRVSRMAYEAEMRRQIQETESRNERAMSSLLSQIGSLMRDPSINCSTPESLISSLESFLDQSSASKGKLYIGAEDCMAELRRMLGVERNAGVVGAVRQLEIRARALRDDNERMRIEVNAVRKSMALTKGDEWEDWCIRTVRNFGKSFVRLTSIDDMRAAIERLVEAGSNSKADRIIEELRSEKNILMRQKLPPRGDLRFVEFKSLQIISLFSRRVISGTSYEIVRNKPSINVSKEEPLHTTKT